MPTATSPATPIVPVFAISATPISATPTVPVSAVPIAPILASLSMFSFSHPFLHLLHYEFILLT